MENAVVNVKFMSLNFFFFINESLTAIEAFDATDKLDCEMITKLSLLTCILLRQNWEK